MATLMEAKWKHWVFLMDHSNNVDHDPLGVHFLKLSHFNLAVSFEMGQALNLYAVYNVFQLMSE